MSGARRGGIPGPESRTGLVRPPVMTEAEFERRLAAAPEPDADDDATRASDGATLATGSIATTMRADEPEPAPKAPSSRSRQAAAAPRRTARPRRVQRMFAIEEELDKKLWLYAIHVGKDRSDVINDLLRPVVASMVLYDSRERRGGSSRGAEVEAEA